MKLKFLILLIGIIFSFTKINAQISHGGKPLSFDHSGLKSASVFNTPLYNYQQMIKEDEENKGKAKPFRFGKMHKVLISPENYGTWQQLPSGEKIWQLNIQSKGAFAIGLIFNRFKLIKGTKLFVYSADKERLIGSFTEKNNKENGWFSTIPLAGETIIIELNVPKGENYGEMQLSGIVHDYKNAFGLKAGFGSSGACNVNVNCTEGAAWQNEKKAVVKYVFGAYLCSGALINNTVEDGTPYLLTANHCISSSSGAASAVFWFNYESASCDATTDPAYQTISSANLIATSAAGDLDFTLLELSVEPPTDYNVYYAGWSRSESAATNTVTIHHPQGDIKKISLDYDPPVTGDYGYGLVTNSHWRILEWDVGTTEGGSSGSPLFDENHRIIGDLTGGDASCTYNFDDYYAKFDMSWAYYPAASEQLKAWLDPYNTGITFLDGFDPNIPLKDNDAKIEQVYVPNGDYCVENEVVPTVRLVNKGILSLTSVQIAYQINGGTPVSYGWTGNLATNQSETIQLNPGFLTAGKGEFKVYTYLPNGVGDERTINDTLISKFDGQALNEGFTIFGDQEICANIESADYFTSELGEYGWSVLDGEIISGDSTENITVEWNEWGQREVALIVTNLCGEYSSETLVVNPSELSLLLEIASSEYPTNWAIINSLGDTILQASVAASSDIIKIPICINEGDYTFIIYSEGDCTSCYYQLINANAGRVILGGNYSSLQEDNTFGLYGDNKNIQFNLYPNPSSDFINIEANFSGVYENAVYSIYNLSGGLVVPDNPLNGRTTINISELRKGYYILKISSDYGKFSQKFLKP